MAGLRDIVNGNGHGLVSSRGTKTGSRRLSDLVRRQAEPASPVHDRSTVGSPSKGSGVTPHDAGPQLKDLEAANQVLQRAVDIVEGIFEAVRNSAPFAISNAGTMMELLVQNLEAGDALLVPFFSEGGPSPSPAQEAVNVCILSVKIGMELGYGPEELRQLGLAALLCDVGMARVPPQILGKRGPLTSDERALLEMHQREGAKLLQTLEPEYSWLAEVVERRYEKTEGPRQPGNKMEEYAAIIRLADIYESLVHHRPFRQRIGPLEALGEILQQERATFSDRILKALIQALSTFPVGSLVRLNTGEIGQVVAKNKDFPLRPVVEVLARGGKRLEKPVVIDLRQSPLHHIEDSVADEALP